MESGIDVRHVRGDRSFYNLQTDRVTLPERDQFASANGYYQTALHELGHATGHPDRLDRGTLKNGVRDFGSVEYAREELRAEISAMLTGARGRRRPRREPWRDVRAGLGSRRWTTTRRKSTRPPPRRNTCRTTCCARVGEHEQAIAQKYAELAGKYSAARSPQISPAPSARPLDPRPPLPVVGRPRTPSG